MQTILEIPSILAVVSDCWSRAEREFRLEAEREHPGLDEEFVTKFFYDKFVLVLRDASDRGLIRDAFVIDLMNAFPEFAKSLELVSIANDLIADVSLHERAVEAKTGGDLGLTIIRPQVERSPFDDSEFLIEEYSRGLLTQAKMKGRDDKWGTFSPNQKLILPDRLSYVALLLYSYTDSLRQRLNEFRWQLCEGVSFETVEKWLATDTFRSLTSSAEIIQQLGNAKIGTDDLATISQFIRPRVRSSMTIRIYWPQGKGPGNRIQVYLEQRIEQTVKVLEL